ncbi:MAG: hypothetical protein NTV97_26960 [Alphaproteobacteria bacterium]|nr:hypothetical protein [Alphaproteobacteria bacterium]
MPAATARGARDLEDHRRAGGNGEIGLMAAQSLAGLVEPAPPGRALVLRRRQDLDPEGAGGRRRDTEEATLVAHEEGELGLLADRQRPRRGKVEAERIVGRAWPEADAQAHGIGRGVFVGLPVSAPHFEDHRRSGSHRDIGLMAAQLLAGLVQPLPPRRPLASGRHQDLDVERT